MNIISDLIEIEDKDVIDYFGNYVRSRLKENDAEKAVVLLEYPVVYLHTWTDKYKRLHIYVGETIDLVRRTDEHDKAGNGDNSKWQERWKEGSDRRSFYFTSEEFNKSLIEDVEDSMIKFFGVIEFVVMENGRGNEQKSYSNKNRRDDALREIWKIVKEVYCNFPDFDDLIERCSLTGGDSRAEFEEMDDDLVFFGPCPIAGTNSIRDDNEAANKLLLEFPVIYMHIWREDNGQLCVYTGETIDLKSRTQQHIDNQDLTEWRDRRNAAKEKWMFAVGGREFNRSLTLDLENRLIQYTIFLGLTQNGRTNDQRSYENSNEMYPIFCKIVEKLNSWNPVFKTLDQVQKESVLMASPLLKLTDEQQAVKTDILNVIMDKLESNKYDDPGKKQLIIVNGSAGTGKTVLVSGLFFELLDTGYVSYFVVNHKELFSAYSSQENAWNLCKGIKYKNRIWEAQKLINNTANEKVAAPDIVFVDEAHLLYTKNVQGSHPKPQLNELVDMSKVTVIMFDPCQFVDKGQYWEVCDEKSLIEQFEQLIDRDDVDVSVYTLETQMRMRCSDSTAKWIKSISQNGKIPKLEGHCETKEYSMRDGSPAYFTKDSEGYEIAIFKSYKGLKEMIAGLREKRENCPACILSTFDSEYNKDVPLPFFVDDPMHWHVTGESSSVSNNIWTMSSSIDEVGSVHDIQGFDLKYAGVLLRGSLGFSKGQIKFNKGKRRGVPKYDNEEMAFEIMANENYVLLSRGMNGLLIYAEDPKLSEALIESIK